MRFESIRSLGRPGAFLWLVLSIKPFSYLPASIDVVLHPSHSAWAVMEGWHQRSVNRGVRSEFGFSLEGETPAELLVGDYTQVEGFFSGVRSAIDVGATNGDFTIFLLLRENVEHVLALEPKPGAYRSLLRNVKLNGCAHRVTALNLAASNSRGVELFEERGSFFIGVSSGERAKKPQQVECIRIDDLVTDTLPDLIKIDVEGWECRVLSGAHEVIRRASPRMLIEVHSKQLREAVLNYLAPMGYNVLCEKLNQSRPRVSVLYLARKAAPSRMPVERPSMMRQY